MSRSVSFGQSVAKQQVPAYEKSSPFPILVSIVEDDDYFRRSLEILINGARGFRCVSAYASAEEILEKIANEAVDVLMMDIYLDHLTGIECIRQLRVLRPTLPIIVYTEHDEDKLLFQALQAGANGYLTKGTAPAQVLEAIVDVLQGGAPMNPHIARKVIESFHEPARSAADKKLSSRETEILGYMARGYVQKQVAEKLHISPDTIHTHTSRIYKKLHVRSRMEAVIKFFNAPNRNEPPSRSRD